MNVRIVQDAAVDIVHVLRHSPVADVEGSHEILANYMKISNEVWVGYVDEGIGGICGLISPSILSDRAYIWMLATDVVEQHKFLFIRHSQMWMKAILEKYSIIHGHTLVGNEKTVRWLRWLGAVFDEPILDKTGAPSKLLPFTIRKL